MQQTPGQLCSYFIIKEAFRQKQMCFSKFSDVLVGGDMCILSTTDQIVKSTFGIRILDPLNAYGNTDCILVESSCVSGSLIPPSTLQI